MKRSLWKIGVAAAIAASLAGGALAQSRPPADDTRSVAEPRRRAPVGEIAAPDTCFAALMADYSPPKPAD